ncbi:MAG TPA: PPOX class F420-dependent oxidoreductase [Jiangellaceae bacterium]|jgi:PPOX class probable F420-dependent enzyme|nr:PPOX class F420-dependent oxidoreductase [Jiangellaceae bacterium]
MATPPLPDHVLELLSQPNHAVMATVRADGQPVSVATWYLVENGRILINLDAGRKRLDHLRRDPRVTLTALKDGDWYTHVSVQGRVVEMKDDTDLVDVDRLAMHYNGRPYPNRQRARISAWIEIDSWHGWGSAQVG